MQSTWDLKKDYMIKNMLVGAVLLVAVVETAHAQYPAWQHPGSLHILTTPEGADLPATASVADFPGLVRLKKGAFNA